MQTHVFYCWSQAPWASPAKEEKRATGTRHGKSLPGARKPSHWALLVGREHASSICAPVAGA
eukprot:11677179-Alexandrium_andersonii.AAC.1